MREALESNSVVHASGHESTGKATFTADDLKIIYLKLPKMGFHLKIDIVNMPADEANKIVGRRARSLLKAFATIGRQKLEYLRTDKPEIEVMLVELKSGGQSGRHMHPVPTLVYVMEGTLTVELDDKSRHKCQAGNVVLEVINTWHNARNMGRKSLKMLIIYLGEKGGVNLLRGINQLARERA